MKTKDFKELRKTWWEQQIEEQKAREGKRIWEDWTIKIEEINKFNEIIKNQIKEKERRIKELYQTKEKINILLKTLKVIEEELEKEKKEKIRIIEEKIINDSSMRKFIMGGMDT